MRKRSPVLQDKEIPWEMLREGKQRAHREGVKQACKVLLIALLSEREGEGGGQRRDNVKEVGVMGRGLSGEGGREGDKEAAHTAKH